MIKKINIVFIICILTGCAEQHKAIKGSPEVVYQEAEQNMLSDKVIAIEKLDFLELHYPKSVILPKIMSLKLYGLYSTKKFEEAIIQANKFIRIYPFHDKTPYAYYIKGMSYYKRIMDVYRDQKTTQDALDAFNELTRLFPNSEYVLASKEAIIDSENILATKELEIGRFYGIRGQFGSAMERYQFILKKYNHTIAAPEAMYRIVEVHYNIGTIDSCIGYIKMLEKQYPNSIWTKKAKNLINHIISKK